MRGGNAEIDAQMRRHFERGAPVAHFAANHPRPVRGDVRTGATRGRTAPWNERAPPTRPVFQRGPTDHVPQKLHTSAISTARACLSSYSDTVSVYLGGCRTKGIRDRFDSNVVDNYICEHATYVIEHHLNERLDNIYDFSA